MSKTLQRYNKIITSLQGERYPNSMFYKNILAELNYDLKKALNDLIECLEDRIEEIYLDNNEFFYNKKLELNMYCYSLNECYDILKTI